MTSKTDIAARLSPGQEEALTSIERWYNGSNEQIFRMFGPAGTGKTTIARLVPGRVDACVYAFAAFSGKAVNVLRSKGCEPASTIHHLIYAQPRNLKKELSGLEARYEAEEIPEAAAALREEIEKLRKMIEAGGGLSFAMNEKAPIRDLDGGLLILDEVSMVGDRMASDLLSFGVKMLVLGDPFQLPPVRGDGSLMRQEPDVMLSEIHRQALDSPVLALATRIREGGYMGRQEAPRTRHWSEYDQVLTWRRATRWNAVRALRAARGLVEGEPAPGDRVMNLANNKNLQVFNGQTWNVLAVEKSDRGEANERIIHLIDESDDPSDPASVMKTYCYMDGFRESTEQDAIDARLGGGDDDAMLLTFSDALTVHKAQGSEWGSVLVMDESPSIFGMEAKRKGDLEAAQISRRWLYTAVTRASREVALQAPKGERY